MVETQRRAYLEAMGIGVWISKSDADTNRWIVGPGSGSTLLLCRTAGESETKLAADIGRSLGGNPVWAWTDPEQRQDYPSLREAVERQLFTRVLIFGRRLAQQTFRGSVPEVLGSASVHVIANLDELALDGTARRRLWHCLSPANEH